MRWPWQREARAQVLTQKDLTLVEWFGDTEANFGQLVNAVRSEYLSAVTASTDAISGTIASLPAYVYRVIERGREEDDGHALARLVRDGWNDNLTWSDGMQWLAAECLRQGNAVAEKITDDAGQVRQLYPLPWHCLQPKITETSRLVFDHTDLITGQRRRLLDSEVVHLRDRSDDGLIGRARSERASPVIAAALALGEHAGHTFKNGSYPSGVVEIQGRVSQESLDRFKDQFSLLFTGPKKAARAMILPNATWKTVTSSPVDQQILEARRFAVEEAARLYQVPPPIIGDLSHGTFTNSETLIRFFAQSTINTWCRKIEAEFARSIFSATDRRTRQFEIDLSGLLRGDPETRWKSHEIAVKNRILTPNEIRHQEGWDPRDGGDEFEATATIAEV